jgi:hypothetical protein
VCKEVIIIVASQNSRKSNEESGVVNLFKVTDDHQLFIVDACNLVCYLARRI